MPSTDAIPERSSGRARARRGAVGRHRLVRPMGFVIASIHEKRDEYRELLKPKEEAARQRQVARSAVRNRVMARRLRRERGIRSPGLNNRFDVTLTTIKANARTRKPRSRNFSPLTKFFDAALTAGKHSRDRSPSLETGVVWTPNGTSRIASPLSAAAGCSGSRPFRLLHCVKAAAPGLAHSGGERLHRAAKSAAVRLHRARE